MSLSAVLFVVFTILKLTDLIDWSWWWVTSPLWVGAALALVVALVTSLFLLVSQPHDRTKFGGRR